MHRQKHGYAILALIIETLLCASNVSARKLAFSRMVAAFTSQSQVVGQPEYKIASVDLSRRWIDLVKDNQVQADVSLPIHDSDVMVRYGVRLAFLDDSTSISRCEEFVQEIEVEGESCESISKINQTLASLQKDTTSSSFLAKTVKYKMDGDFVAQLQLVRTLRPPPSPGFSETTTSIPPEYNPDTDSFVTGPLKLELRPLVATVNLPSLKTEWDIFHNVSPADTRGHFLLLPTLSKSKANWRGQSFTSNDCHDLIHLTDAIRPFGSLLLGFNSVGAGASQNHIHCHCWPSPPLPFLAETETKEEDDKSLAGWNCYAASNVESIYDFYDIMDDKVQCSFLKYPVFCVQLSASSENLNLLAKALSVSLEAIGDAPYNIGFMNRPQEEDDEDEDGDSNRKDMSFVDVFLFCRSKERSDLLPPLKLGISEMMGLFHAQSDSELQALTTRGQEVDESKQGPMMKALNDVSVELEDILWTKIKDNLVALDEQEDSK